MYSPGINPTHQPWLNRVAGLRDTILTHADATETNGTLAQPVVDALRDADLFTLKVPKELGGAEADPMIQMAVIEALSYIHPATGWCAMIGNGSNGLAAGYLPDAGIEQIFAHGQIPIMASSFFPASTAKIQEGGYLINGRWRFGSGIRHTQWILAGAVVVREGGEGATPADGPPEVIQVAFPTAAATIHDNWQVMGLKGTGSCDFSLHDHFVPTALTYQQNGVVAPQRGGPLYRLAIPAFLALEHIGFALGVARRALDELVTTATTKRGQYRKNALSERAVVHRFVGEYDLKLRAARALAFNLYEEIWDRLCNDQPITPNDQLQS
ncbi:MAG TPA: acyl-CoA dehydrogenase family protein, partial [Caldilineaceae bacterium]|nr:acyl-CoA dehydrogenase family protein [Caldilineaceae bacterium]